MSIIGLLLMCVVASVMRHYLGFESVVISLLCVIVCYLVSIKQVIVEATTEDTSSDENNQVS